MILPSFRTMPRFISTTTCVLLAKVITLSAVMTLPVAEVQAQTTISGVDRKGYVEQFIAALPEGSDYNTASKADFEAAVQKVILSHPASKAPSVAYAITSLVGLERATEIAEAITKLFDRHPELRELSTDIARAMTDAIRARVGPPIADHKGSVPLDDHKSIVPLGDNPAIQEQIERTVTDVLSIFNNPGFPPPGSPFFPRGVQPGEIISHETPVMNL